MKSFYIGVSSLDPLQTIYAGWFAAIFGVIVIAFAYVSLLFIIPKLNQKNEAKIGILAHKAIVYVVIGGFIILILGLISLMGIFSALLKTIFFM